MTGPSPWQQQDQVEAGGGLAKWAAPPRAAVVNGRDREAREVQLVQGGAGMLMSVCIRKKQNRQSAEEMGALSLEGSSSLQRGQGSGQRAVRATGWLMGWPSS